MSNTPLNLSYTKASTFLRCRKRYEWIYQEELAPKGKTTPLVIGSIIHMLLDLYTQNKLKLHHLQYLEDVMLKMYPHNAVQEVQNAHYEVLRLFRGYIAYWDDNELEIISPELHLENQYTVPDTQYTFKLYARVDALALDESGRPSRLERKTTNRSDSAYLKGLKQGLQAGIAHWLLNDLLPEHNIKNTYYDMMVKTKIAQFYRTPVRFPNWKLEYTKKVVYGIVYDIYNGNWYPSLDCFQYARECSYAPLCRELVSGTQQSLERVKQDFFEPRKEVMTREQDLFQQMLNDTLKGE